MYVCGVCVSDRGYFLSNNIPGAIPNTTIPPSINIADFGLACLNRPQGIPVFVGPLEKDILSRFGFGGIGCEFTRR